MNRMLPIFVFAMIASAVSMARAESYDGKWEARLPQEGRCPAIVFNLVVAQGKISGTGQGAAGSADLEGTVKEDGSFTFRVPKPGIDVAGAFSGQTFIFHYKAY